MRVFTEVEVNTDDVLEQIGVEECAKYHGKELLDHISYQDIIRFIDIKDIKAYYDLYEEGELREKYFREDVKEVLK